MEKLKGLVALGSLITVVGLIFLFFSVNFGISLADNWLAKQGGADTSLYLVVIEGYIKNFVSAGSLLFGIGLATLIFSYYKTLSVRE